MQTQTRIGDWFKTHSGIQFHLLSPRVEDINIDDIAHALARVCRFGGHTRDFYSVVQHSVIVSQNVPAGLELCGLLHDATEAYIGDMVRPLKYQIPQYRQIEDQLWEVIAERFNLPAVIPDEVKHADNVALITERRDLLQNQQQWGEWTKKYTALENQILPLCSNSAEAFFTMRFNDLMTIK